MTVNGSTDELAFWRERHQTLTVLKARGDLGEDWDAALADCESEIRKFQPPKQKRRSFVTADILGRTMELAGVAIRDFLTKAFASRDARLDVLEAKMARLDEWKDVGVWDGSKFYKIHNHCTHDGSSFVCLADHQGCEPGGGAASAEFWRLCVKRGRQGKDARR